MSFGWARTIYLTSALAIVLCLCWPDPLVRYTAGAVVLIGAWPIFRLIVRAIRHEARQQLLSELAADLAPTLKHQDTPRSERQESDRQSGGQS